MGKKKQNATPVETPSEESAPIEIRIKSKKEKEKERKERQKLLKKQQQDENAVKITQNAPSNGAVKAQQAKPQAKKNKRPAQPGDWDDSEEEEEEDEEFSEEEEIESEEEDASEEEEEEEDDESVVEDTKPKKRIVYAHKKKKRTPNVAQEPPKEETPVVAEEPVEEEVKDEDSVVDDWENEFSDEEKEEETKEQNQEVSSSLEDLSLKEGANDAASPLINSQEVSQEDLSNANLRSPICVILGHVDTGKTKLLDKIRQTNVQEGEAGGITQQIGATYFPLESILQKTESLSSSAQYAQIDKKKTGFSTQTELKVPGLLIIDTPGHESFTNLRSRGQSLCNIAILVIDLMHGLEPQTIESINLLKKGKTPFIVALNKIDRLYSWKTNKDAPFLDSFKQQKKQTQQEFMTRLSDAKLALAEQGLNSEVYFKNPDVRKYVSIVPTSALTGEGVPDLLMLLCQLTQDRMTKQLYLSNTLEATVLEVKVTEGHGHTIDVILSNGILREGDRIVLCGLNGPIVTQIRALLTPQPMRELRVKSAYVHHKEIKAAMGVKIAAHDLEKAVAGSRLHRDGDLEELKKECMKDLTDMFSSVESKGVCVQASTLGSLEALLSFLKDSKIPVSGINVGPIHKKDVMRASIMVTTAKEFATILAFDVKVDKDAQELAEEMGVKIFTADIIYHLFDQFTAYMNNIKEERKKEKAALAIWPCILKIVPGCIFNKKDPIILGVDVVEGSVKIGTPICIPSKDCLLLGKVQGIENNHKPVQIAKKGQQVAIRIEDSDGTVMAGRQFGESDELCSKISRQSIDVLKELFRADVTRDEWLLIKKLKTMLHID